MKELDAVKLILRHNGKEAPNSITDGDPDSQEARLALELARQEILSQGLGFNSEEIKLPVNASGKVLIPAQYLSVRWAAKYKHLTEKIDPADSLLYVWDQKQKAWYDLPLEVMVTYDVTVYTSIPHPFAMWIAWYAAANYHFQKQGMGNQWLEQRTLSAKAKAFNSLPPRTTRTTSGFLGIDAARAR